MTSPEYFKNQCDAVSVSRKGQEKRANFVNRDAMFLEKQEDGPGKFVNVLSAMFLKWEPRGNSCA